MNITRRTFLAATAISTTTASALTIEHEDQSFPVRYAANVEMWWRNLPFIERIHAAADAGFDVIEFWPWRGKDIDAIAQVCKDRSIEVAQFTAWGFAPGMNNPKNHEAFVKEIEEGFRYGSKLYRNRYELITTHQTANMQFGDNTEVPKARLATYPGCKLGVKTNSREELSNIFADCMMTMGKLDLFWRHSNCGGAVKIYTAGAALRSKLFYGLDAAQLIPSIEKD